MRHVYGERNNVTNKSGSVGQVCKHLLTTKLPFSEVHFPLEHYTKGTTQKKMRKKCGKCEKMRTASPSPLASIDHFHYYHGRFLCFVNPYVVMGGSPHLSPSSMPGPSSIN